MVVRLVIVVLAVWCGIICGEDCGRVYVFSTDDWTDFLEQNCTSVESLFVLGVNMSGFERADSLVSVENTLFLDDCTGLDSFSIFHNLISVHNLTVMECTIASASGFDELVHVDYLLIESGSFEPTFGDTLGAFPALSSMAQAKVVNHPGDNFTFPALVKATEYLGFTGAWPFTTLVLPSLQYAGKIEVDLYNADVYFPRLLVAYRYYHSGSASTGDYTNSNHIAPQLQFVCYVRLYYANASFPKLRGGIGFDIYSSHLEMPAIEFVKQFSLRDVGFEEELADGLARREATVPRDGPLALRADSRVAGRGFADFFEGFSFYMLKNSDLHLPVLSELVGGLYMEKSSVVELRFPKTKNLSGDVLISGNTNIELVHIEGGQGVGVVEITDNIRLANVLGFNGVTDLETFCLNCYLSPPSSVGATAFFWQDGYNERAVVTGFNSVRSADKLYVGGPDTLLASIRGLSSMTMAGQVRIESVDLGPRPLSIFSSLKECNSFYMSSATATDGNPIDDLSDLGSLRHVDDMFQVASTTVTSFDGLALDEVGRLYVNTNEHLMSIDALESITKVENVVVKGNEQLQMCLPVICDLCDVANDCEVDDNGQYCSLDYC
mmetsp:Transcript_35687/g.100477  ORF Transcript_35687/g.100477 Transcript_35687/m.100477 type:complete len:608 (+) Transcript_35687:123-1946(+)